MFRVSFLSLVIALTACQPGGDFASVCDDYTGADKTACQDGCAVGAESGYGIGALRCISGDVSCDNEPCGGGDYSEAGRGEAWSAGFDACLYDTTALGYVEAGCGG